MLSWIKNVFKKAEPQKEIQVPLEEAESWFNESTEEIKKVSREKILSLLEELVNARESLMKSIIEMRESTLRNPNITDRELQLMKGNKSNYLKNMSLFHEKLKVPETTDKGELNTFLIRSRNLIDVLNKTTHRSFQVLQHFLANETKKVASEVALIEEIMKKIEYELENGNLYSLQDLQNKIQTLVKENNGLSEMFEKKQELEEKQKSTYDQLESLKQKISKVENSRGAKELSELKTRLEILKLDLKELQAELNSLFYPLDKVIKKYNKGIEDEVLNSYLESPHEALIKDKSLEILEKLKSVSKDLKSENIEIKEDKREKALAAFNDITKEVLEQYRKKIGDVNEEIESVKKLVMNHETNKKLKELGYKSEALSNKIESIGSEIINLSSRIKKKQADNHNLRSEINKKLPEATGIKAVIR